MRTRFPSANATSLIIKKPCHSGVVSYKELGAHCHSQSGINVSDSIDYLNDRIGPS